MLACLPTHITKQTKLSSRDESIRTGVMSCRAEKKTTHFSLWLVGWLAGWLLESFLVGSEREG